MKRVIFLIGFLTLFILLSEHTHAQVDVTPSKTSIIRGQATAVTLNYLFTVTPTPADCEFRSNFGEFRVGATTVATNPKSLIVNIPSGVRSRTATEILNVPVSFIERALKLKSNKISYRRNFTTSCYVGNPNPSVSVNFTITTEAAADFDIQRIELYFENRRAEITIPKNYKGLKAFAEIKFTGSGLLKGYWEVDGRILSYVNQHITYGRTVILQTPEIPPLPTFETGIHLLRFVVTNPQIDIPLPVALYFVTAQEVREIVKIKLISPEEHTKLDYIAPKFVWERLDGIMLYLIQFFEDKNSNPIFSAYTRDPFYQMPDSIFKKIFQPAKRYYWRVIGFDENNDTIGESSIWDFSFQTISFVPDQIIIALSKIDFEESFIVELKRKYNLEVVDFFYADSLDYVVFLFKTDEDILERIEQIKSEKKIVIVQPNYIYLTLSEPMKKFQYAFELMKLDKLHKFYRGKGIKVAIIDTGVDYEHRDLKDRIVFIKNFIKDDPYRKEIHGTAVAGVIGASLNDFGIVGVAPEVEILALRACRQIGEKSEGRCTSFDVSMAMDEAIKRSVKVINMSLGCSQYDRLLSRLIDKAVNSYIFVVVPVARFGNSISFPASHPEVISVGGIDEKGNPYPETKSRAKVLAPSENIFTTFPGDKHNFISGVSLSSAYVSGLLSLYCEKGNRRNLPAFKDNICKWEEELFAIPLCD